MFRVVAMVEVGRMQEAQERHGIFAVVTMHVSSSRHGRDIEKFMARRMLMKIIRRGVALVPRVCVSRIEKTIQLITLVDK